jgi:hypothetical protein
MHWWLLLIYFAALGGAGFAQDPAPSTVGIKANGKIQGDGTRKAPFVFPMGSLGKLAVGGDIAKWNVDDCPMESEVLGTALLFATDVPGEYHTFVEGTSAHAWFVIKSGNSPPTPETELELIARRVKTAMTGNPGDAAKFAGMCNALAIALDADQVPTLESMSAKMDAALKAVGWPQGKYPDMSKLAGQLWGAGVESYPLDATTRKRFSDQLRVIAKACLEVK